MLWAPVPCDICHFCQEDVLSVFELNPESACNPQESLHSPAPCGQMCVLGCIKRTVAGQGRWFCPCIPLWWAPRAPTWSIASGKSRFCVLKCIYSEAACRFHSFWLCSLLVASALKFCILQKFSSFRRKIWTWPWTLLQPLGAMLLTSELKT